MSNNIKVTLTTQNENGSFVEKEFNSLKELNISNDKEDFKIVDLSKITDTVLPSKMFSSCINLEEVILPSNLEIIDFMCFKTCSSLVKCDLSHTKLEELDDEAFAYCSNLPELKFPETLRRIGSMCFKECSSLVKCDLSHTKLEVAEKQTFLHCFDLQELKFPETLRSIGSQCLWACRSLIKCDLSHTKLEEVERSAFGLCHNLPELKFPETLIHIGYECFNDCLYLGKVYFEGKYSPDFDLDSLNTSRKYSTISGKTSLYYKNKNKKSWSKTVREKYKDIKFLLYPDEQLKIILPVSIIGGLILIFVLYKGINKIFDEKKRTIPLLFTKMKINTNKSLTFTILLESCFNAIVFYILFSVIEYIFIAPITKNAILKALKKNKNIFVDEFVTIPTKDEIKTQSKDVQKKVIEEKLKHKKDIFDSIKHPYSTKSGLEEAIKTEQKDLNSITINNLKNCILIITPIIVITVLLLAYYKINNKFNDIKINVNWGHMILTVFVIGILITLYEIFIVFYYLQKSNFTNPYITYYLWARGISGQNGDKWIYSSKKMKNNTTNIINNKYNIKEIDKYCDKNDKCKFKDCITKEMCDNINTKIPNNLLNEICNDGNSDSLCIAP